MEIKEAIERLNNINQTAKIKHMAQDMWDGTTPEEREEYQLNFKAVRMAIEVLEEKLKGESIWKK